MVGSAAGFDPHYRRHKLLKKRDHLLAPQLLAQNHCLGCVHPVKLEEALRGVHPNSANLFHRRSPFSEICNDLILAHAMPSGAVHPNTPIHSLQEINSTPLDAELTDYRVLAELGHSPFVPDGFAFWLVMVAL